MLDCLRVSDLTSLLAVMELPDECDFVLAGGGLVGVLEAALLSSESVSHVGWGGAMASDAPQSMRTRRRAQASGGQASDCELMVSQQLREALGGGWSRYQASAAVVGSS